MQKKILLIPLLLFVAMLQVAWGQPPSMTNTPTTITMTNYPCFTSGNYDMTWQYEEIPTGTLITGGPVPATVTVTWVGSTVTIVINAPTANFPTDNVEGYDFFGENFYLGGDGPYGTKSLLKFYQNGALKNYIDISYTQFNCYALPIEVSSFTGYRSGNVVQLNWVTDYESMGSHFVVERNGAAISGIIDTKIGTVPAVGESQIQQYYSFTDNYPLNGTNRYRLRAVDLDGSFKFTNIIPVSCSGCTATPPQNNCSAVSITGPDALCYLGATYNLTNVPNYTTINWSITPTSVANWGGNDLEKAWIRKVNSGTAVLQATLGGCTPATATKTKTIAVGVPSLYVQTTGVLYYSSYTTYDFAAPTIPGVGYYDYVWYKNGTYYAVGQHLSVNAWSGAGCDTYEVRLTNGCGTASASAIACFIAPDPLPDPCNPFEWVKVDPVPASSTMRISVSRRPPPCPDPPLEPYRVELTDIYGAKRKQQTLAAMKGGEVLDVSTVPNGIYILRISDKRGKPLYTKEVKILH